MTDTIKIGSIVLVVILAISSVWMYTSHQDQMYEVNSAYIDYVAKHQFTDSEYLALLDQVSNLTDIVNLNEQRVLMDHYAVNQPAGGYNNWTYTDIITENGIIPIFCSRTGYTGEDDFSPELGSFERYFFPS